MMNIIPSNIKKTMSTQSTKVVPIFMTIARKIIYNFFYDKDVSISNEDIREHL